MNRRHSRIRHFLVLAAVGASLAGCAVYPARTHYGGGHGYRPYAYSAPSWGGRGYGYGGGYSGGGWGYRNGWR